MELLVIGAYGDTMGTSWNIANNLMEMGVSGNGAGRIRCLRMRNFTRVKPPKNGTLM